MKSSKKPFDVTDATTYSEAGMPKAARPGRCAVSKAFAIEQVSAMKLYVVNGKLLNIWFEWANSWNGS